MALEQDRDASDRGMSTSARSAATSSASVGGGGAVAVAVATCPSPVVLQTASTVVPSTMAVMRGAVVGVPSSSGLSSSASSGDDDDDVLMSCASERQWKALVTADMRERLVDGMLEELRRITGRENLRHLRMCASRYESLVWKKSNNETEYTQKLERRIQSLRRQPSQQEIQVTAAEAAQQEQHSRRSGSESTASIRPSSSSKGEARRVKKSRRSSSSSHHRNSKSSSRTSSGSSSSLSTAARDEQYFARLLIMKAAYRDEVALVFRELCRVNTVIQNSASLRRHESNNLGDFLANLKKIIYLLEQQPDEMHGMIPPRKRTLEYLDVVESHIQRKVLPILYRLRHTYSTILRPLVLNYLRNCTRVSRRL